MMFWAEKLEYEGNCVLSVVYPAGEKKNLTQEQISLLGAAHKKRIDLADAVFIVNKNGYIGLQTSDEIEYAKKNNKEIIYMEKPE